MNRPSIVPNVRISRKLVEAQKVAVKAIREYEEDPSRENTIRYVKALNKLQLLLER